MPASSIDLFHMHDARNNFDALRPAPVCPDANQFMGQCQSVHVSMNCYYGYHEPKNYMENANVANDCEMMEVPVSNGEASASASPHGNGRKRSAEHEEHPLRKRLREEVQIEKSNEPETNENAKLRASEEELESLYWNIHGGNIYHLIQCL